MNQYEGMSEAALKEIVRDIIDSRSTKGKINENYMKFIAGNDVGVMESSTALQKEALLDEQPKNYF